MRTVNVSKMLGMVALALAGGAFAAAQDSGWYVGANIGQSRSRIAADQITANLMGAGFATSGFSTHERDTGYKIYGGYEFNRYLAIEGGYFNLGQFKFQADTLPEGTLDGSLKAQGENLDLVLSLPFTRKFSAFARAGITESQVKDAFSGTGELGVVNPGSSKNAVNYKFGGGLQYAFTRCVAVRAEVERYRISDPVGTKGDLDLASVGLVLKFGRHAPAAAPVQAEPAPVAAAPAPAPAPAPVPVAAPVRTQVYCSILDLRFDIDQEAITREDREKLAVVGTFMTKYPETTAVIEGHTDNVGSPEHNQKLSQGRADSVVAYLVETCHIDSGRLSAVGYGEGNPTSSNATEEGKRENRRIDAVISCATDIEGLTVTPARITMAMVMEFDKDKAEVKPEYDDQLRKVAGFMKKNPQVTATVEGHTANMKGSPEELHVASRLRAQNVVDYLVAHFGIDRARLNAEGYGDDRRFAYNSTTEGQHENRRVNIIINYPK